ncbi:efflux RND transporter permease subunit, partial [candidate division KSB1 bacterium]|nr:efflux RND transporter permease subunit [candidate division KSB1 bacterium]
MTRLVAFFVRNKVWTNVMMFSVFGFGLIALSQMRYSFFPEIKPSLLTIQVVFPGASPEEVEEGVVVKIEEEIDGISGIERVTSVSRENLGSVTIEITKNANMEKVLSDVRNAVDRIGSFPIGIEKPVIFEQQFRTRSLSVVLYGAADLYNLKHIADNLREDLIATPEISQVSIAGLPNLEFSIEVSESDLRKYRLTFDEIAGAVASANINLSGGKLETAAEEILIRAYGRRYLAEELQNVPVRGNPDGTVIYLKEVARVVEQWEDVPNKIHYNGRPAVVLNIDQTEQEDILAIADRAKGIVARFNDRGESVQARILDDRTIPLRQRIGLLVKNGLFGLLLVIITLGFFLNLRLSYWVSVGIPFSFAGMFLVANLSGITINVMSLFGMILVVGILVDDAIVVAENIYVHFERGKSAVRAAIDGAREMTAPVFTSVATTILAFTPFFFLDGTFGRFIWQMALVVISALFFSLVESFLILPAHLAHSRGLHPHQQDSRLRKRIEGAIAFLTHRLYAPSLRRALRHKWVTVVMPVALVMVTVGLVGGGFIGLTFFPFLDGDTLPINVTLVPGRQEAATDSVLARIERVAVRVGDEMS